MTLVKSISQANTILSELESKLVESSGEITPEIESMLTIKAENELQLSQQIDSFGTIIERIDQSIEFYKDQIAEIRSLTKGLEKAKERMKAYVLSEMDQRFLKSLSGSYKQISIRINPPALDIVDEALIPDEYKEVVVQQIVRNDLIKDALKSGIEVDGARLTQSKSLSIKIKKNAGAQND